MEIKEVLAVVESIKYKPNWTLRAERRIDYGPDTIQLFYCCEVPDSSGSGRLTSVASGDLYDIRAIKDSKMLIEIIWRKIMNLEYHEAGEWFRVGNTKPYDEHDNPQSRLAKFMDDTIMKAFRTE